MKNALRFLPLIFLTAGLSYAQTQLIGVSSVQATLDNNSVGEAEAFLVTASVTGSVTTLSVYLDAASGAKTLYVGLYSNSNGHPTTRLGMGTIASPVAGSWNTVSISPAVQVTAGTAYHIAVLGTGGSIQYRDTSNGTHSETSLQTNLTSLPAAWSSGLSWQSGPVSAYGSGSGSGTATGGVQIGISPSSATVNEGGTKQFTATVTGTSNTAVNWSVTSGTGAVSTSGLFTAPNRQEADIVRAQSKADLTKTASASITVPPVSIQILPTLVNVAPKGTQQFTATVGGTVNNSVRWSEIGNGTVNQSGLYTAPSTNENDTVIATAVAAPSPSANATASVQQVSNSACGNTLTWTNSLCQQISAGSLNTAVVNGVNDPNAWTVISRHGEYSQSENECNVPGAISQSPGLVTITTSSTSSTCGNFNADGTTHTAAASWPYKTGDFQMNKFSFSPSGNCGGTCTLTIVGKLPPFAAYVWPSFWLLGSNCQDANKWSGDTGFDGCPDLGSSGYQEVDMVECWEGYCGFHAYNPGNVCAFAENISDSASHTFKMVWTGSSISISVDGNSQGVCSTKMAGPLFLITQTQTCSSCSEGPPVNSKLPVSFQMQSVSVTSQSGTTLFKDNFGGAAQ
jgi:hypothetical protein